MIRYFMKIALRNLCKHKGTSLINIAGLSIGIACSILIILFVTHERSYDRFHEKAGRIYRLAVKASVGDTKINQTYSSAETFRRLLADFPEIEKGVKFLNLGRIPVVLGEKTFYESRFYAVDSTFFEIFSFPLISGSPGDVLREPKTMVISKNTALKYFGDTDVIGKSLSADFSYGLGRVDFQITGRPRRSGSEKFWGLLSRG